MIHSARYVMIGGFLGAGKTTALAALAQRLTDRGLRVGLITNDQSVGLVDTTLLRSRGYSVEEISGGCFCCRFDSLRNAAERLTDAIRPDLFVAEPVGSCTDLIATVSYPLRRIYGDRFTIAPLSVMVDPVRASRVLGIDDGRSFSSKVVYVYRKQLEEADLIVVNKCDEFGSDRRDQLRDALRREFPTAELLCVSSKTGAGMDAWFDRLESGTCADRPTMDLDYATYADGEALLGWLNCTVRLEAGEPLDGNRLLLELAEAIGRRVGEGDGEIAHLKMTLDSGDHPGNLSVVSLVRNDASPDLRESLLDRTAGGSLIVNLRAEADPELLRHIALDELEAGARRHGARIVVEHVEHFRPAPPRPTHRIQVAG